MNPDLLLPSIQIRPDYSIPRVIIGAWQLSDGHSQNPIDREALFSTFDKLVDHGLTTFDCADIYTGVEELLGEYLRRRHARHGEAGIDEVQIHTKFVPNLNALSTMTSRDVERIVDRSRMRLGVDQLHVVQFAWWDYDVPRYVEVASWLTELTDRGVVHLIGATNFDHIRLRELLEAGIPIALHQVQYSIIDQRPQRAMTKLAVEDGVWLVCYGVLAGGYLTERYLGGVEPLEPFENRSLRKYKLIIDEFGGWDAFQRCLAELNQIAARHGVSVATVAIRYMLDRQSVAAVVLGMRSQHHLDDVIEVFRFCLDESDKSRIDNLVSQAPGPSGNVFELERNREGVHGRIMKYNLNQ